jgi:hypothetical protein
MWASGCGMRLISPVFSWGPGCSDDRPGTEAPHGAISFTGKAKALLYDRFGTRTRTIVDYRRRGVLSRVQSLR